MYFSIDKDKDKVYCDGQVYSGIWKNNNMEGYGTMGLLDGRIYSGIWKKNKLEGYGVLIYINGLTYGGVWKNNKLDGKGYIIYPNKQKRFGIWDKNVFKYDIISYMSSFYFYLNNRFFF